MIQGHTDAYLGVMGSAVDTAEAKKLNLAQGVYVDDVNAVSPAFKGDADSRCYPAYRR